ncbi:MAG: signal peptidase I [Clostridia bacterium]|nr:signal peptidase I [Clostridia bacterium]
MSKKEEKKILVPEVEAETAAPTTDEEIAEQVEAEVVKKPGKKNRVIGTIVNVVLVIAIVLAVVATYLSFTTQAGNVPALFGLRLYSVQTTSMEPTLMKGDLVVSTAVKDPAELKHEDIITYWTVIDGERVLNTHRIIQISKVSGGLAFTTQGDNNTSPDAQYVHQKDVVGKVAKMGKGYTRLPGVGKAFDYLQEPTGFGLVVVLPVLLFLLYQLIQFFRVLFEYQNVKNRIKFEMERGRTEDLIDEQRRREEELKAAERARIEAELREKLRAELMAEQDKPAEAPVKADNSENTAE